MLLFYSLETREYEGFTNGVNDVYAAIVNAEKDGYHQQKLDDCRQRVDCLLDRALEQVGE
jgi:hypothetical protein